VIITETDVASAIWPAGDWEALATAAVTAAFAETPRRPLAEISFCLEVSVRLADDAEVHALNFQYRTKDKPTNVLSFPMHAADALAGWAETGETDLLLGDLALGFETVVREAAEKDIAVEAHVTHLLVHGTLHLLGHDHLDDAAADAMEALETRILAGLGIGDPYADLPRATVDESR
jgi:probable rRNA maturation factor